MRNATVASSGEGKNDMDGGRVSPLKGQTFPVETLSGQEIQDMLRRCSRRGLNGVRNRALITVMYRSGLRLNEALALFPKDLDPAKGTVRVLHGKGDKARTSAMDAEAFAVLQRWLDLRERLGFGRRVPLFCTRRGTRLHGTYVRSMLKRLASKAGIEKRVHPHALRHTYAAELAAEGVPINLIQAALGHANVSTTSRYLAHIAPQQVIDMARARQWKAVKEEATR